MLWSLLLVKQLDPWSPYSNDDPDPTACDPRSGAVIPYPTPFFAEDP